MTRSIATAAALAIAIVSFGMPAEAKEQKAFIREAIQGNLAEIEMGKLAAALKQRGREVLRTHARGRPQCRQQTRASGCPAAQRFAPDEAELETAGKLRRPIDLPRGKLRPALRHPHGHRPPKGHRRRPRAGPHRNATNRRHGEGNAADPGKTFGDREKLAKQGNRAETLNRRLIRSRPSWARAPVARLQGTLVPLEAMPPTAIRSAHLAPERSVHNPSGFGG
jgi:hypothetical protein